MPEDFYTTYLQKINDVTVEDIQRVANKYFKEDNLRIIVVGNGAEVLENLEKTGIPVKFFDKYAKAAEKPVFSKPLPAGLTADTVIENYITAIGGEASLNKINTILVNSDVTIQGAPFKPKATIKQMAPNKSYMEIVVEGMGAVMQQSFNGESGYMVQQGQKTVMDDKMLSAKKAEKGLFPELYIDASSIELESIMTIDGTDVYKVKVTKDAVASYRYYDTKTNYLVRTEESAEMGGQTMTTITDYSNYKEVNGVKFPNTMKIATGPQVLSFETTEVKVNEGVSDADFN